MPSIPEALAAAVQHHQAGRLQPAEQIYRQILQAEPSQPEAIHFLGVIAHQVGQHELAVEYIRRAIELKPNAAEFHNNLAKVLHALHRPSEAVASARRSIELKPSFAAAHDNLGVACRDLERWDEALVCFQRAVELQPDFAEAHDHLGSAFGRLGKIDQAVACYRRAVELNPTFPGAYNNLGNAVADQGSLDEAIACYRRAAEVDPGFAEAHSNLGLIFKEQRKLDEAVASYRRALELKPDSAEVLSNLGNAHKDAGRLEEAIACFRRAVACEPPNDAIHSNLINALHYHPAHDGDSIQEELRAWNRRFADPLRASRQPHANDRDPSRRLRIGYVSPDFREHVVGWNVLPILKRHDQTRFQVFCYAGVMRPDALTERFRKAADVWRDIGLLSDQAASDLIRADRIDLLIDLSLHTAGHRLTVFARKPAPVQVTWAGYPGSTGLDAIDYRLTDPYLDPPASENRSAEQPFRLPYSFWCYHPPADSPPVSPLPALSATRITFGSLNNFCKVNDEVIALWARLLIAVNGSRLLLLSKEGAHRERTAKAFERCGVAADRIEWLTPASRSEYLAAYHRIDIGLDPFPYNGHTTSLDSFWMGVPVVTLLGKTIVGRGGLSQAMNLGFPGLIAATADQYVEISTALARDLPRLRELRATLRHRLQASPLMDDVSFTQNIETAYGQMWRRWCER